MPAGPGLAAKCFFRRVRWERKGSGEGEWWGEGLRALGGTPRRSSRMIMEARQDDDGRLVVERRSAMYTGHGLSAVPGLHLYDRQPRLAVLSNFWRE